MFKIKHCLIPLLGMFISVGSVKAATESEKSIASIEKDLLNVVATLSDEKIAEAKRVLSGIELDQIVAPVKPSADKVDGMKSLVGLNLERFLDKGKTSKNAPASKQTRSSRAAKNTGISQSTYRRVMALSSGQSRSTKRSRSRRRYRPCYQYSYQELQDKSRRYQESITQASRRYGVNENLIKSVITAESCFKVRAKSHKGARGLMQLMPATARRFGVRNSYNSHQNIGAGTKYLRWLLDRFRGNVQFALAGYNAGEGKVDRYGGIPPYKETREYVRRVMGVYRTLHGKKDRSANLGPSTQGKPRAHYQRVWFNQQKAKQRRKPMNQRRCVKAAPSHLKNITYLKRSGRGGSIWRRYYKVNRAENLANVTQRTGVHINALKRMNRLSSYSSLQPGQRLVVWECRT